MSAKRDENFRTAAIGISDTDSTAVLDMQVETTSVELLVEIVLGAAGTPPSVLALSRDANHVPIAGGLNDAGNVVPFSTDTNGNLRVDITT